MRRMWVVVVALGLVVAACTDTSAGDADSGVAAPVEQTASGGGVTGEGIEVHGDWTITVVNPDGSVASEREFSNALVPEGRTLLSGLLSGQETVNAWAVYLGGGGVDAAGDVFYTPCADGNVCLLVQGTGLDMSPTGAGVQLTGSMTAVQDGFIDTVGTGVSTTVAVRNFTSTAISPEFVLAGQEVFVTVTISFS